MSVGVIISLNEGLFLREPQDSKLGRRILKSSIHLIDKHGFEAFTFKKLAVEIGSTEASIYRYFVNKHYLLVYLVNWYWEWVRYLINAKLINVTDPKIKLQIIIKSFVTASKDNPGVPYIDESILHKIVISEGWKAYHTKNVDEENTKGFFKGYKRLATTVSEIVLEVNPDFRYPYALASHLFEMSNDQIFFSRHLPKLTELSSVNNVEEELEQMLNYFMEKLLQY